MNRHATDVVALTLGGALLALVVVWALVKTVTIDLPSGGWFLAGGLIVAGLVGMSVALRPSKR